MLKMKSRLHPILPVLLLFACSQQTQPPPPPLTYFGEKPRIQNPLRPEDSQKHIQLPKGFTAELYAAEPNIINPIAMAWDERGRLWVVQSQDYPHELENDVGGDRITICEDTDGDGRADKFTDFATEQSLTTGIAIVQGGAIVAQAPDMVLLTDTDGDDKMDGRKVLFGGFGIWDTHAGPSNLHYGIDNMIWGAVGYSGFEYTFGQKRINFTRGVYRFQRDGSYFEPIGQFNNNTWGCGITADHEIFGSTANNNHACYIGIPLRYYEYLGKLPSWAISADFIQGHYEIKPATLEPLQQVDVRGGFTAASGANFYTATNYPKHYQNQMYVNEPTGHLVHIARMVEDGAGYQEVEDGNIFASTDAWTAPVVSKTGPDGNLWVADWYNPVIQHNPDLRGMPNQIWNANKGPGNAHLNPHRDKRHGRIYVIKYRGKSDHSIQQLGAGDLDGLLSALEHDNMFWRTTAQRLLVENFGGNEDVKDRLHQLWTKNMHNLGGLHVLWTLAGIGQVPDDLVHQALRSRSAAVRKAGVALLSATEASSDRLVESEVLQDENLYVRRNAALRASELPETGALYQAMEAFSAAEETIEDKWLTAAAKVYFREQNTEDVDERDVELVLASSAETPLLWKYTTEQPASNWMSPDFDDSEWEEAPAAMGTPDLLPEIKTSWTTDHIWMRKVIDLESDLTTPVLKTMFDDNLELYANGRRVWAKDGQTRRSYLFARLDEDVILRQGTNTLAVHCENTGGGQYIDVQLGRIAQFTPDRTIVINTVPSKMAYDQTLVHATAGEKVELVLNNVDEMQHNLVLVEPGSTESFGKIVDQFTRAPEAAEMQYVPKTRYVLAASNMLDPGESEVLQIELPDQAGDYPYICTFPAHWQMMQGVLRVNPAGTYISTREATVSIANMGGGSSHDFLQHFAITDGRVLHQQGKNTVLYTEDPERFAEMIPTADLLYISNNKPFTAAAQEGIFTHVRSGKPMMIYHPSVWYNWTDWPAYNRELVAGGSRSHEPLQEFAVEVVQPGHAIMQGVPRQFRIIDELYRFEKDARGHSIQVLAVGRGLESGDEFPVVWIVNYPRARILVNTLGHDGRAHQLQAYQRILENGMEWCLGGRAL